MKEIFGHYRFAEKWAEINPRMAFADKEVNLDIGLFAGLDVERAAVVDSDCTPIQVQAFMIRVSVALSYCAVMIARLGGLLVGHQEKLETARAQKAASLVGQVKSDAALERQLGTDQALIAMKWEVEDLKVMQTYAENVFRVLTKDAENWRARFYGAQQDRKLTPGVEDPSWSHGPGAGRGVPPSYGGQGE